MLTRQNEPFLFDRMRASLAVEPARPQPAVSTAFHQYWRMNQKGRGAVASLLPLQCCTRQEKLVRVVQSSISIVALSVVLWCQSEACEVNKETKRGFHKYSIRTSPFPFSLLLCFFLGLPGRQALPRTSSLLHKLHKFLVCPPLTTSLVLHASRESLLYLPITATTPEEMDPNQQHAAPPAGQKDDYVDKGWWTYSYPKPS